MAERCDSVVVVLCSCSAEPPTQTSPTTQLPKLSTLSQSVSSLLAAIRQIRQTDGERYKA